jgi:hypothetical protein
MEASIISAILITAGNLLGKVLERGKSGDPSPENDRVAADVAQRSYDTLRKNLTDGCVKVLKILENGEYKRPDQLFESMYPELNLSVKENTYFQREFGYRLQYMKLNGVLLYIAGRDCTITRLGLAFLEEARRKNDYHNVLS